ncbi:MAG TPA: hypothetical protein VN282_20680 [Pyrinomonadaceae bacterium]|nr:hypothetical protein [Pyrinomonadaceae bacterium]
MPWSAFVPLGGEIFGAPAVLSRDPSTVNLYARGMDSRLYQNSWSSGIWQGWRLHEDSPKFSSDPAACSLGTNHEQVFVDGPDGVTTKEWQGGTTWTSWKPLPKGIILDAPAAVSRSPEVKNVYARGLNNSLWQNSWFGGNWGGWEPHNDGSILSSAPAVISTGPFHEQVFVRGEDHAVWTKEWTASNGWTGWESLGGKINDAPTAVSRQAGIVNVYAWGKDDRLWQISKYDGKWHDWQQHLDGFPLASRPVANSLGPDHEQVYVQGRDKGVWTKWWAPTAANRIRVHLVDFALGTVIVNDTTSMFGQLAAAWQIFAGGSPSFWIEPASFNTLDVPLFHVVEIGECKGTATAEQKALASNYRFGANSNEIVIYNVLGTNPVKNGCATFPSGAPSAVIAMIASPWTMAHELGHVLGLDLVNDSTRLMFDDGTWGITDPPPELSAEERKTIYWNSKVLK